MKHQVRFVIEQLGLMDFDAFKARRNMMPVPVGLRDSYAVEEWRARASGRTTRTIVYAIAAALDGEKSVILAPTQEVARVIRRQVADYLSKMMCLDPKCIVVMTDSGLGVDSLRGMYRCNILYDHTYIEQCIMDEYAPLSLTDEDLRKAKVVCEVMKRSSSLVDWDMRADLVKKANGGRYPDFWFEAVLMSGIFNKVRERDHEAGRRGEESHGDPRY